MKILHSSDLHGQWEGLFAFTDFDVWIDTGDFFPNKSRGKRHIEVPYQTSLASSIAPRLEEWLRGRPALICPGNHDYTSLSLKSGIPIGLQAVEICGLKFAGFRNIPFIAGEWNYESTEDQIGKLCDSLSPCDVLVTHTAPANILDASYGSSALAQWLTYKQQGVKMHLFGHVHDCGGQQVEEMGILFRNGAQHISTLEVTDQ